MNVTSALKGYLSFHVAFGFVNLLFIYLSTGATDYGGSSGFFPSAAFANPFTGGTGSIAIAEAPGDNVADSAFFLLRLLSKIGAIARMMAGLFIFGYPIVTDVGTGTYTWVALAFQTAGTIGSTGFAIWLIKLGLQSGLLGNIWVLVLLGIIGSVAVASAVFT